MTRGHARTRVTIDRPRSSALVVVVVEAYLGRSGALHKGGADARARGVVGPREAVSFYRVHYYKFSDIRIVTFTFIDYEDKVCVAWSGTLVV